MAKSCKFRELVKVLRKDDARFEVYQNRGKGSERMLYHPDINGWPESYPLKCPGERDTNSKRPHCGGPQKICPWQGYPVMRISSPD